MSDILLLGLGYSAERIARRLAERGWRVVGTATSADGACRIRALGFRALVFDGKGVSPDLMAAVAGASHLVVSIPPGPLDPALIQLKDAIVGASRLGWVGYLSTVGVYGDHGGAWVDETSEVRPVSDRSRERVVAERGWLALAEPSRRSVELFRLAGIYGPGRSAIEALSAGTARRIVKPGQVFNRIHVDDIATTVVAAIDRPGRHDVYNVADDEPAPPQDVVAYGAELLGVSPPPEVPLAAAGLGPMGLSFYGECKRVRNSRIREALGVRLAFPTYREGLRSIAAAELGSGRVQPR